MRSRKAPHPRRPINARSSGSFFSILAKQPYRNDPPGVIVHVSQPVVGDKVVQIDTEPSDARQRPPMAPVESLHSENPVDKAGNAGFHSK